MNYQTQKRIYDMTRDLNHHGTPINKPELPSSTPERFEDMFNRLHETGEFATETGH